ncbi:MAG: hypothetical protein JJE21_08315 [Spirochaetaceae bacterium]|nr:hypothetical protein [Spirochaetaceae bacterium]
MYFWDNLANAKFWKKEKIRKAEDSPYPEEYKIIIAKISCENLFDFTDTEMVGTFCNILYLAKQGIDKKRLKKMGVGQIIDLVFNI